jgi:glycosyltransferase involved in cell wall biosynthesis
LPPASRRIIEDGHADLLASGRLRLPQGFLREQDMLPFLRGFDVGLCLYALEGRLRHDFNYLSAPSGKMFNYFAAGLPVLASAHVGLAPVREHDAGLLVHDLAPDTLRDAAQALCREAPRFRAGALAAADAYDFPRAARALVDHVLASLPR